MHHEIGATVQHGRKTLKVGQIQPDNQLVYLLDPAHPEQGMWMREVDKQLIPYDITQGKPLIEIPTLVEEIWDEKDVKMYGDEGKPKLGGTDR